jgi:predicted nucleic acid-binding protein
MPLAYADSSVLFALFYPRDTFHEAVNRWLEAGGFDFLTNEALRLEVRHNLRQVRGNADGETAWRALQVAERSAARMRFAPLDLERVFIQADLLSQRHAASHPCGATDVLHVAAAIEQAAPLFLTCDAEQAAFAQAAGLRVHRFEA